MSEKSISEKLLVKPGRNWVVINRPVELAEVLCPAAVESTAKSDVLTVCVKRRDELVASLPHLDDLVNPGGIVWIVYPKLTSKLRSDVNRDSINDEVQQAGWVGVAMISINETWSALRIRHK